MLQKVSEALEENKTVIVSVDSIFLCITFAVFSSGLAFLFPIKDLNNDPATLYAWTIANLCICVIVVFRTLLKFTYIGYINLGNPSVQKRNQIEKIVFSMIEIAVTIWGCYVAAKLPHTGSYYNYHLIIWFYVNFIFKVVIYGTAVCCVGTSRCCMGLAIFAKKMTSSLKPEDV